MNHFALATYKVDNAIAAAMVIEEKLYDLAAAFEAAEPESREVPAWVNSIDALVADWDQLCPAVENLAAKVIELVAEGALLPVADGASKLMAPLKPNRIFGTASNYHEHAAEMETKLAAKSESSPYVFMKATTSVIGPNETVIIPPETEKPDWEVELAVVIGRACRRVKAENALDYIAGYTVVNDISARDMNRRTDYPFKHDWFRGKSWDTFCPLGPWFVPKSCIEDPHKLGLKLTLNDKLMQDGNTSELIWDAFEQIAYLSSILTLQPGDVIATGTPAGVGMGQGIFLKPGDVMVASVEGIGELRNPVAAEEV